MVATINIFTRLRISGSFLMKKKPCVRNFRFKFRPWGGGKLPNLAEKEFFS